MRGKQWAVVLVLLFLAISGCSGLPTQSNTQEPADITVKIAYDGEWTGSIGSEGSTRSVEGSGTETYQMDGEATVVSVSAQKQEDDDSVLSVLICYNDILLAESQTSADYGVASVSSGTEEPTKEQDCRAPGGDNPYGVSNEDSNDENTNRQKPTETEERELTPTSTISNYDIYNTIASDIADEFTFYNDSLNEKYIRDPDYRYQDNIPLPTFEYDESENTRQFSPMVYGESVYVGTESSREAGYGETIIVEIVTPGTINSDELEYRLKTFDGEVETIIVVVPSSRESDLNTKLNKWSIETDTKVWKYRIEE